MTTRTYVAGITMWIRRKCAPGSLYSPWTRNCGKYDTAYNYTDPWMYDVNGGDDNMNGGDNGDSNGDDNGMMSMNGRKLVGKLNNCVVFLHARWNNTDHIARHDVTVCTCIILNQ